MPLGKGMTGGYLPVAATMATEDIFGAFCADAGSPGAAERTFYHGHTFTGNSLGCAAASASVDLIFESRLLEQLPGKVNLIAAGLAGLVGHPNVGDIRQCGCMVGIELVADRRTGQPFDPGRRVGSAVCRRMRDRGVILRPLGDVVVLMPAPAMDAETLERLVGSVTTTICEHFEGKHV